MPTRLHYSCTAAGYNVLAGCRAAVKRRLILDRSRGKLLVLAAERIVVAEDPEMSRLSAVDARFLRMAYDEAEAGFNEGGCPIGSVLAEGERLIAQGRNQRVQQGDPIAHGEMDCLRKAGRQKSYRRMTLYTSLSPCMMCTGTVLQFGIPRVVIGEDKNFAGNPELLRQHGVEVVIADDPDCIALMARFIRERPDLWHEDIMESD
jgi:cytosine/creatinine deaminase